MAKQTDPDQSPWARPEGDDDGPAEVVVPTSEPADPEDPPEAPPVDRFLPSRPSVAAGTVTTSDESGGSVPDPESEPDVITVGRATRFRDRRLAWYAGGAGALVVLGLVVVLVAAMLGWFGGDKGIGPIGQGRDAPDTRPTLARLCPPPTNVEEPRLTEAPPPPPGPRTVDRDAGISFRAYGEPWVVWDEDWRAGTLGVRYRIGQHFITEAYAGGSYHASILSGSVPATVNDGTVLDLKCTGQQVAADVRASYYPQPNRMEQISDGERDLGGRKAWVSVFRLHFKEEGLKATDELVAVAMINVGRPEAAILYVSIPGTHRQFDPVVENVLTTVRPT